MDIIKRLRCTSRAKSDDGTITDAIKEIESLRECVHSLSSTDVVDLQNAAVEEACEMLLKISDSREHKGVFSSEKLEEVAMKILLLSNACLSSWPIVHYYSRRGQQVNASTSRLTACDAEDLLISALKPREAPKETNGAYQPTYVKSKLSLYDGGS